jgi:hypothetical protein
MTEFKPGDRVQYNAVDRGATRNHMELGTVKHVEFGGCVDVLWDGDTETSFGHGREYLVLVAPEPTPPTFKPGDRVTVRLGIHEFNDYETGVVREVVDGSDGHPRHLVLENGHWGYTANAVHFVEPKPTRPLVGPAPKVEAPVFVAPFRANGDIVEDATGNEVLAVGRVGTSPDEDDEFAAYVADALNARVSAES